MDKKGAHSALMRGVQDPFACTVLVARQRRVKLTLELSFLRRASRWSAPSAKPRRRVSGTPTGTIRTSRSARFATTDRYVTRVDPTRHYFIYLCRHILTHYLWCSFSQLAASRGKCSGCGKDGANTSRLNRSKPKKNAWYCMPCIFQEVRISGFSFLFLSLPKRPRRHDNFSHKLFRLDSRRSSSIFLAGAGHCCGRGDDVRDVRDGYY